jgi:hypothetical protein
MVSVCKELLRNTPCISCWISKLVNFSGIFLRCSSPAKSCPCPPWWGMVLAVGASPREHGSSALRCGVIGTIRG